ncbi:hypothetical protein ACJIZ3_007174 [Penstemon smallii]|uniref:Uncharacterized protein n=1 Tax=Penstemon smallii TaxID=265156 RepID=A0ABD3S9S3_9LAMI
MEEVLETSEEKNPKSKKPLSLFFKEAVGISANTEDSEVGTETDCENAELKEKLRNLEEKVRSLNKKRNEKGTTLKSPSEKHREILPKGNNRSLYALFSDKKRVIKEEPKLKPSDHGNEDPMVHKELSADMQMLAYHLYKGGYLKDANFTDEDKFDLNSFEASYARDFLKFAAITFAKDHQEIATRLLKEVINLSKTVS